MQCGLQIIGTGICICRVQPVDNIAGYKICVHNNVGKSVFLIDEGKYLLCQLGKFVKCDLQIVFLVIENRKKKFA